MLGIFQKKNLHWLSNKKTNKTGRGQINCTAYFIYFNILKFTFIQFLLLWLLVYFISFEFLRCRIHLRFIQQILLIIFTYFSYILIVFFFCFLYFLTSLCILNFSSTMPTIMQIDSYFKNLSYLFIFFWKTTSNLNSSAFFNILFPPN